MPSHKQKRDRKKSHKHRNRSRSTIRRHNKKNEGKKKNISRNSSTWDVNLRDISSYMENRREMLRQMFSSVGEGFLTGSVPPILKQVTREELKRICFEELTTMSADVVFKILEGIPCDTEVNVSSEECSKKMRRQCKSSKNCCGHTSKISSAEKCYRMSKNCRAQRLTLSKGEDEALSSDERRSETLESSSSEESQSDIEKDESRSFQDNIPDINNEAPSTSYQPSMTKKLAKVAPFHISVPRPEITQPTALDEEEGVNSSELENEISYEIIDLSVEEDIQDGENESDLQEEVTTDETPSHGTAFDGNSDSQGMTEEEIQQSLSEVLELEHRARAIRSMLANMDIFKTKSLSANSNPS